ncbi:adhesion G-protein coupled receptor G5 [Siphateles boraxobius]|uniref:adhesion G-protein coupled receptor G5 n=1 Tax=Siphateles boraxobius TaxID=180520 RepID=UPI0040639FD7
MSPKPQHLSVADDQLLVCEFRSEYTELSPLPPAKKTQRAEDMSLLLLLIMIYGLDAEKCINERGSLTLTNDRRRMDMRIALESGHNITVLDKATGLVCNSSIQQINSCYIECSFNDFFKEQNFTETLKFDICAKQNEKKTRVEFRIQNTKSQCIVVDCLPDEITELLNEKDQHMNIPKDLRNLLNIKKMCEDVILKETVVNTYIRLEKKAIHGVINMTVPGPSITYLHEDLSMTVVKMNLSVTDDYLQITAPGVLDNDEVAETCIPVKPFQNQLENKIGVVTYDADQHFKLKLGNDIVTSKIIRIEFPGPDTSTLTDRLKIQFKINPTYLMSKQNMSCQFYDEKGDKTWKNDGCLTNTTIDDVVECSCDHMTPFAVLLVNSEISEEHWKILSYISYVGCGLSAFFSASSVLSFMFNSNARAEVSSSLHVSLSGSLFLLNISFMLSEWAATLGIEEFCVFIAVMIHYSLLSCFTWMAIEALHLYLLLIRVFNIYIRHYMIKLSLIGWGVPAIIVGGLLSVHNTHPFYGTNEMTLSDTNKTNTICWIKHPLVLYGVNLSYFTVIFLFNLGILITVSRQIFKLRQVGKSHGKMPVWKDAGTVLGLMSLMGTTWGLAFFGSGYTNYVILYLFCILNSMQGFYIFLWMCGTARKNRAQTSQSKTKSTVDISK